MPSLNSYCIGSPYNLMRSVIIHLQSREDTERKANVNVTFYDIIYQKICWYSI